MKRNLLFMLGASIGLTGYSQCEIEGITGVMCVEDAPVELSIESPGAVFSGPGMSGNIFNPVDAGVGTHEISVTAPGEGYTAAPGVFDPIDISGSGTSVFLSDDAVSGACPIGFDFLFFGTEYSNFYISSNGFMTFSGGMPNGCCSGQLLPNGSNPNNLIAFAWEDLNPSGGGIIRYSTVGTAPNRILVMEFSAVPHYGGGSNVTTQVQLHESGNCVEIHTTTMPSDGGLHTMGIENVTGSEAYTPPGRNRANWTITNDMYAFCPNIGCETSIMVEVVDGPEVNGSASVTQLCEGEELTLTVTGTADTYSFGVGIDEGVAFVPETPGANVFIVSGIDEETGCITTDAISVFVHELPAVSAGPDKIVCDGEEFTLTAIGDADEYEWDNDVVNGMPMTQDVGVVTYTVIGTNEAGCESTSSVMVDCKEVPTGTGDVTMMTGFGYDGEIDFTPTGGTGGPYTFEWSNGATTEDIDALTVGTYTVTVADEFCESEVTFYVDTQAGINDDEMEGLNVYPNPVVDHVIVDYPGEFTWVLFDNQGKIVTSGQGVTTETISMAKLAAGNYLLSVESNDKSSVISLIKE